MDTKINIECIDYSEFPEPELSDLAKTVLEKRYLKKNEKGEVIETPKEMFIRVASAIAAPGGSYLKDSKYQYFADRTKKFYNLMVSKKFLPNSPTLMNAGKPDGQLAACFVLPVKDSIPEIFDTIKYAAMIHKSGGGTGFSFSRLRPKNSRVGSTGGIASGPLSFIKIFNSATEQIKQGGTRRGANMAILRVDHPDILDFIHAKEVDGEFNNFNFSVGITNAFMKAVEDNGKYDLINPMDGSITETLQAKEVFDLIVQKAWESGEPGIIFLDKINADNSVPELGNIEATNPCGEQPLLPYEACNLGSINLSEFYSFKDKDGVDWPELRKTVHLAVEFLDNVIDVSVYPLDEIRKRVHLTRKIGLGVMGFADLLFKLRIPYDSVEARKLAGSIMEFIEEQAHAFSKKLAEERGTLEYLLEEDILERNAAITTIAPTGTLSIIANCSSGIEPLFALFFKKNILDGGSYTVFNPIFEKYLKDTGLFKKEILDKIVEAGSIQSIKEIPAEGRKVFATAMDIQPLDHLKMQAAFQEHTDNAVSKTVNLPASASVKDVGQIFIMAYKYNCKGVTVYRDGSRSTQVLTTGKINSSKKEEPSDTEITTTSVKAIRPNKLHGFTQKINTGLGILYLTVNEIDGKPFEVFATIGKSGRSTTAKAEAIGRLVSLALRSGISVKEIVSQIKGIGGEHPSFKASKLILSIPDAIAFVLEENYIKNESPIAEEKEDWIPRCPECGEGLVLQEGCRHCPNCGYSHCG